MNADINPDFIRVIRDLNYSSPPSCCLQSLCDVFLGLSFEFFHFSFYAFIRLVHRGGLIQFILSFYFVFIDTHDLQANKSAVTEVLEFDDDFDASVNLDK